jgi:hypothetical protein
MAPPSPPPSAGSDLRRGLGCVAASVSCNSPRPVIQSARSAPWQPKRRPATSRPPRPPTAPLPEPPASTGSGSRTSPIQPRARNVRSLGSQEFLAGTAAQPLPHPAFFPLPGKGAAWALRQPLEPFHREGSALGAGLQDLPCVGRRARIAARHALCAGLWGRAGARGGLWAPGARAPRSGDRGAGVRTTARRAERAGARGARPQRTMRPLPPIPRSGGQGGGRGWNKGGVGWSPFNSFIFSR